MKGKHPVTPCLADASLVVWIIDDDAHGLTDFLNGAALQDRRTTAKKVVILAEIEVADDPPAQNQRLERDAAQPA